MHLNRRTALSASALAALSAAGCSSTTDAEKASAPQQQASGPASAAPSAKAAPSDAIQTARVKAAQYDYDGALKLLAKDESDEAKQEKEKITKQKAAAVKWADNSKISHIFYHSLIIDTGRAFSPSEPTRKGYAEYMVTFKEFTAQLQQIYDRGYVLVHPQRIVAPDASGKLAYQPIYLPKGKKPLVLSIDDVSYYEYMKKSGFATNLFIDADGRVRNTYHDAQGKAHVGAYDVSTVVDDFVLKHPDLSYRGDKGTIALTGYDGVLGYRTSLYHEKDTPQKRKDMATAKKVADAMKADGWNFASHSWGHINMLKSSPGHVETDSTRWDDEVKSIIGPTEEFIFAFGVDGYGSSRKSPLGAKYPILRKHGFRLFFPIDSTVPSWTQLDGDAWRQMRIGIDGTSMGMALKNPDSPLHLFFDVKGTWDPIRATVK